MFTIKNKDNIMQITSILQCLQDKDCFLALNGRTLLFSNTFTERKDFNQFIEVKANIIDSIKMAQFSDLIIQIKEVKNIVAILKFGLSKSLSVEMIIDVKKTKIKVVAESRMPKMSTE